MSLLFRQTLRLKTWNRHFRRETRERIGTLPNALTLFRIGCSPCIGALILESQFSSALALLVLAGITDGLDGWIARRFNSKTVLGSALDPMADKILMTTLVASLHQVGALSTPLSALIISRDILLVMGTAYYRYQSLPLPKTWSRYFDPSLATLQVRPPFISKLNTVLQLSLMFGLVAGSAYGFTEMWWMDVLKISVGMTTLGSGLYYYRHANQLIKILGK